LYKAWRENIYDGVERYGKSEQNFKRLFGFQLLYRAVKK
jgi:hypothetical protein